MRYIDEAVDLDPRNAFLLTEAAWTHGHHRDYEGKLRLVERALDLQPNDGNLVATKAQALIELDRIDEAVAALHDAHPDGAYQQLVLTIRMLAYLTRDFAAATAQLAPMLQRIDAEPAPTMPLSQRADYAGIVGELQLRAGDVANGTRNLRRAEEQLAQLLHDEPGNFLAAMALANTQSMLGEYDVAIATIDAAIAATPRARDALYGGLLEEWRARIQARHGDRDAPIAALGGLLHTTYAAAVTLGKLRRDVDWDSLRGDTRFQALLSGEASAKPVPAGCERTQIDGSPPPSVMREGSLRCVLRHQIQSRPTPAGNALRPGPAAWRQCCEVCNNFRERRNKDGESRCTASALSLDRR